MNLLYLVSVFFLFSFNISAQQTLDTSGGEASGSGGTLSYSIGQLLYNAFSDSNNTETQGVQQPFEISVISDTKIIKDINLKYKVFPNPAHTILFLELENELPDAFFQLFDITGNLIKTHHVSAGINQINAQELVPAIYILKLSSGNKLLKSFKIIKN
jgi:hypothetical protein